MDPKVRGPTALHCPETGDPLPKPGADVELERIASAHPRSARSEDQLQERQGGKIVAFRGCASAGLQYISPAKASQPASRSASAKPVGAAVCCRLPPAIVAPRIPPRIPHLASPLSASLPLDIAAGPLPKRRLSASASPPRFSSACLSASSLGPSIWVSEAILVAWLRLGCLCFDTGRDLATSSAAPPSTIISIVSTILAEAITLIPTIAQRLLLRLPTSFVAHFCGNTLHALLDPACLGRRSCRRDKRTTESLPILQAATPPSMGFEISLASLVDQNASDYADLYLNSSGASSPLAQTYLNSSQLALPVNLSTVPQIFVVNPSTDNIFRHVNPQSAHAAIVALIYFSTWMGALGWDIVSTIHFDLRLVKETLWSSSFSALYSVAYLLSRYMSLAWLITVVTNSVIMTNRCDAWMKGSTAMFSVAISATMLVFCLRTCSIWHMKQKVVSLVVSAWLIVVSFAILLPVMSNGNQLPTSNFCSWHFNGLYVVGLFGALLLFDLLCLVLTVCKLNKAGWRGLVHGIFPSSRYNLDAEDVKTMLVQKTTAFFAIQFLFLISALLVYVLTDTYSYRMMNIVASVAVASSMAGRIFRRAWRQTRELAPHNLNRPPSYFPAWAEEHRDTTGFARPERRSSSNPGLDPRAEATEADARNKRDHDKHDSLAFYVEGEYRPKLKSRSMSSQSLRSVPRTPLSGANTQQQQMREMETGQVGADPHADHAGVTIISRNTLVPPAATIPQNGPAPAYSRRLGSAGSSRPNTGDQRSLGSSPSREMAALPRGAISGSLVSISSHRDDAGSSTAQGADRLGRASHEAWPDLVGGLVREDKTIARQKSSSAIEERRRTFVASPPMTARVALNSKEVYDVDSVKAAARFGGRHGQQHESFTRPATASSAIRSAGPDAASSGSLPAQRSGMRSAEGRPMDDDVLGSGMQHAGGTRLAFLRTEPRTQEERTPRPKTAPNASSPSLSPSGSITSQMTVMPRDFGLDSGDTEPRRTQTAPTSEDDVLFAFLNTVEEDAQDRAASSRGGEANADASRRRVGTSESSRSERSGSGTRPSTAVGEAVKPFGYGVSARGPRTRPMRAYASDEEADEGELGSVIQQQYAKLALRAGMPLDPA
ncbi:hypothetical protein PANT_24c00012 [Moesziomyces antarcticus T-34]|uniref:Uncharacterized protein n=1 Tax=Pseudozyma antarctica (strain T-34) TaxID=1151754 RepID=M9LSN9_PSEA3|nr:hypothetical protein PANT_24c00012 [Moesziomyces antarcticus T-34]